MGDCEVGSSDSTKSPLRYHPCNITEEAVENAEQNGIIFIDEIDKIASGSSYRSGADVSREGVQRDILPIVEGSVVNTKYGPVKTDHILFMGIRPGRATVEYLHKVIFS